MTSDQDEIIATQQGCSGCHHQQQQQQQQPGGVTSQHSCSCVFLCKSQPQWSRQLCSALTKSIRTQRVRRRRRRKAGRDDEARRSGEFHPVRFVVLPLLLLSLASASPVILSPPYPFGDPSCPCATGPESDLEPINRRDITDDLLDYLGLSVNLTTYGVGCAPHDVSIPTCVDSDPNDYCSPSATIAPEPPDCDRSWCIRNWCFVDPANCTLLHALSPKFVHSNRYYSYATCGDMDSFTQQNRLASLHGRVLRAGFTSNTGGWTGSYSSNGSQFAGPPSRWSGPTVSFVRDAARTAGFRLNLTVPPSFLNNRSVEFFDSTSKFDLCVYATALGHLDMCVGQFSVTDQRAATTNWFILSSQPLYLIVFANGGKSWSNFLEQLSTIFQPFTAQAWVFIILFVVPVMGVLMIVHEYGKAGSAYPRSEAVVVIDPDTTDARGGRASDSAAQQDQHDDDDDDDNDGSSKHGGNDTDVDDDDDRGSEDTQVEHGVDGRGGAATTTSSRRTLGSGHSVRSSTPPIPVESRERHLPFSRHIVKSIYMSLLATLQQSYGQSIVTYGGMVHLLGIAFFTLTIIAVYTANLAAILTREGQQTRVNSLEDAIRSGYVFCGERKNVEVIMDMYDLHERFVLDPVSEGGDNKPGFDCDNCRTRRRVFDYMKSIKGGAGTKENGGVVARGLYCDAAIAPLEDLEVMQSSGRHCNKTYVGDPIRFVQTGMPVYEGISRELVSLFLKLKNEGVFAKELIAVQPDSQCPSTVGEEGDALTIAQLTGIWIITFGFATVGLLVTYFQPYVKRKVKKEEDLKVRRMHRVDQWGVRSGTIFEESNPRFLYMAGESTRLANIEASVPVVGGGGTDAGVGDHDDGAGTDDGIVRVNVHSCTGGGGGGRLTTIDDNDDEDVSSDVTKTSVWRQERSPSYNTSSAKKKRRSVVWREQKPSFRSKSGLSPSDEPDIAGVTTYKKRGFASDRQDKGGGGTLSYDNQGSAFRPKINRTLRGVGSW